MDFITPRIAIGTFYEARGLVTRRPPEVGAVLNVAAEVNLPPPDGGDYPFEYCKVGLVDGGNSTVRLIAAVTALLDLCGRHSRVLVHCRQGISRSVVVVALGLAIWEGTDLESALQEVCRRRPFAGPHPALVLGGKRLLERYGVLLREELHGLGRLKENRADL